MTKGYLVFNGGAAFSSRTKDSDYTWLKLVRGEHDPRLVVVPVAAMRDAEKNAQIATRYFKNLGTFPEYALITDHTTANASASCEILNGVEAIVLIDGSPIDMVERLQGTQAETALRQTLARKTAVMATGASAMALGAVYWFAGQWEPGLRLAPHLAILPHHNLIQMRLPPDKLLADLPDGVTLIGVDEATSLICYPDGNYAVTGEGNVTVYRSVEQLDAYGDRGSFTLQQPDNG
ncbi:MAG: hypothetical protein JXQ72_15680 [Anaerolineae bacterium]|nr:hypothetical protein [Anaerolineae bacterium]